MGETWRVLERIVWWGMVYSKISNRKIYINTPHFTLKFLGCYNINVFVSLMKHLTKSQMYGTLAITKHNSITLLQTKIIDQIL